MQSRLEERFPAADPDDIADAIEDAAEDMADAKITTFRPLLVEHKAGDALVDDSEADTRSQSEVDDQSGKD